MAAQPPDVQGSAAWPRRQKAWRAAFVALGLALAVSGPLFVSDGLGTVHNNLGLLTEIRGLLQPAGREQDTLLTQAGYHFQDALRWNPEQGWAYYYLGVIYLAWRQKAAALEAFQQAARQLPHSQSCNYQLGMLYDELGQEGKAVAAWQEARAAPWLVGEGQSCQSQGDAACAERFYKLAITVQPDYGPAHYRLGVLYAGLGRKAEAADSYDRARVLESEQSPERYVTQARIYALEEDWEQAIAAYRKAIELNPYNAEPYERIASILLQQFEDSEGAIAWYLAATGVDPQDAGLYLELAEIYRGLGDCAQAELWYGQALGFSADNPRATAQALLGLGRCALHGGDLEAAERAATAAVNAQPGIAAYHVLLGDVYAEMGSYGLAIESYKAALELDPNNRRAQQQLTDLGWHEP